jgi:beta-aspartyl-peptidase (threonine type)
LKKTAWPDPSGIVDPSQQACKEVKENFTEFCRHKLIENMDSKYGIAIHGGAGTIRPSSMTPDKEKAYRSGLGEALRAGNAILESGGSSLDAVSAAVISLENCPLFNAGKGSVFTHDGKHEMDASIMRGDTLSAGACAGVRGVRNPITLARAIMEKSEHVMLCRDGAEEFARLNGIPFEDEKYFHDDFRYNQWKEARESDVIQLDHSEGKKMGTVGAVALDQFGNLAAATSTGGMTNKKWGRIGDSPVIGAGTYANNLTCAISCTGHGEYFIRAIVAYDISCLMEYKNMTLEEACRTVVNEKLVRFGGEGGLVAIDASGNICLPFNSEGMYRGWKKPDGDYEIHIYREG